MMRIGFGLTTASPTIISSPSSQIAGWSAPTARPPSSGTIGMRLKRFRKKPTNASAMSSSDPFASAATQKTAAPTEPRIGPARATFASFQASSGSCFIPMTAPRKGMKSGALAGTPWRRSSITWPSSCTKMSSTKPIANGRPQIHAYAAIETSIEAAVVKTLSLKRIAPYLTTRNPIASTGAKILRSEVLEPRSRVDGLVAAVAFRRAAGSGSVLGAGASTGS